MTRSISLFVFTALAAFADPRVYISVNGTQKAKAWQGSPVLIEAVVTKAEAGPSLEQWRVEVLDPYDSPIDWAFRMSNPQDNGRRAVWLLDPQLTRETKAGSYRLRIVSESNAPGTSNFATMMIAERPAEPTEADLFRDLQWQAYYEAQSGMVPAALNRIDDWLRDRPADTCALAYRADLLERSGRVFEALLAYNRAIEAEEKLRKDEHSREPAGVLYIKRDGLLRRMLQR